MERLVATGLVADYTAIWWDARIHPKFGTLEIRSPDQPTSVTLTAAFAALFQTLVPRPGRAAPGSRLRLPRRLRPEPLGGLALRAARDLHPS